MGAITEKNEEEEEAKYNHVELELIDGWWSIG
jgi:hypothetical protein